MAEKLATLSENIAQLTLLEAANLVKILEEKLGVSAAAPQMMAVAGAANAGADAGGEEEKTEFNVAIIDGGPEKIKIIKEIRASTGLGLKEAKEAADGATTEKPFVVKEGLSRADADALKKKFEEVGAKVSLT